MKEIYHCTPKELDEQSEYKLQLHFQIFNMERKEEFLRNKRGSQKK